MSARRPIGFSPRCGSAYTTRGVSAPAVISSSTNSLFPADSHVSHDADPNAIPCTKALRVTARHTARDRPDTTRTAFSTGRRKVSGNRSNGCRATSNGSGGPSSSCHAAAPHRAVPARHVPAMTDADAEMNSPPKLLIAQDLRGKRSLVGIAPSESAEMAPHPCAHEASRQSVASTLSLAPTVMQRSQTVMGLNGDNDSYGDGPSRSQSAATSFSLLPRGPVVTEAWARTIVQPHDEYLLYTRGDGSGVGYEELARKRQALRLREQRARLPRHVHPSHRYSFTEQSGYTGVFINGVLRGRGGTHSLDTSCEDVSEVGLIDEEEERARTVQLHERHIIARGTPLLFRRPSTRLFVDETDDGMKSVGVKSSNGRMSEGSGCDGAEALQSAGYNGQRFSANADIFMTSSIMSKRFDPSGPLGATKRPLLPSLCAEEGNTKNSTHNNNINNNNNLDANGNSPTNGLSYSDLQSGRESGIVPHSLGSNDMDSFPSAITAASALDFALGTPSVLPHDSAVAALLTDPIFVLTGEENFERLVLTQEEHEGHKVLLQMQPWGAAGKSPRGRDVRDWTSGALFQTDTTAQSKSPTPHMSHMRFEQPKLARDVQRRRIHSIDLRSYVPKSSQREQEQQQQEEEEEKQEKHEETQKINGCGNGNEEVNVSVSSVHTEDNSAAVDPTVALPKKSNSVGCKKRRVRRSETQDTPSNHSLEEYPQKRQEKQNTKIPQSTSVGVRAVKPKNGVKSSAFPHQQENSDLSFELHLSEEDHVHQSAPVPNNSNVTSNDIPPLPTVVDALSDVANKSTSTCASLSMNGHSVGSHSKKSFPPPQPQSQPLSSDRSVRHANNTNAWSIPYPTESPTMSPTRYGSHSPSPRSEPIGKESPKASVIGSLRPVVARASPGMSPRSPKSSRSAGTPPYRPSSPASSAAEEDFLQTSLIGEEDVEIREFVRFALGEQRAKSNEMNTTALLTSLRMNRRVCTKKTGDDSEVEPRETADEEDEDFLLYDTDHYTENVACILSTFGQLWRTPFHETMNKDKLPEAVQAQLLLFNVPDAKSQ